MPIYEYHCPSCARKFDFLVRNIAESHSPSCPKCGSDDLTRLVSRFASVRSEASKSEPAGDFSGPPGPGGMGGPGGPGGLDGLEGLEGLDGVDENDPKAMARWMKKMGQQMGEDLPPEFNEYCSRLEAGEDPEKLEEELGGAMGGEGGGEDDGTLYE